jgi:ADP-ribose pyrophosphatase YjhB (NUDIX family)
MKFCSECGSANLTRRVPDGDHRMRYVCPDCGTVHYKNPLVVCGVVPVYGDKVLLCRRGIEPRYGKWTLPAGFMELEESVEEGAQRELLEEAVATVELGPLLSVLSVPRIGQVHIMYQGTMKEPKFETTPESTEVRLYCEDEIPWDEIAFRTVALTLKHFFECRKTGLYPVARETLR